jgi:hypothetical protein
MRPKPCSSIWKRVISLLRGGLAMRFDRAHRKVTALLPCARSNRIASPPLNSEITRFQIEEQGFGRIDRSADEVVNLIRVVLMVFMGKR